MQGRGRAEHVEIVSVERAEGLASFVLCIFRVRDDPEVVSVNPGNGIIVMGFR